MENRLEARYEEYRERLKNLTIMSDVFMRNVFKKRECTEYVLRVVMGKNDLVVLDQTLQKDYKNLQGRSAVLDCVARDTAGRMYDVEIQQDSEGAGPKRARYYAGLLDMNTLDAGADFEELPETYLIFITRDDVLGRGLPIYHVSKKVDETGEEFGDGSYIIYVNAGMEGDTELGRLMHDFHCKSADEMHSPVLAERVRELKETPEGVNSMCKEMEEIYNEGRIEGRAEGHAEGCAEQAKKTAFNLAARGMKEADIADILAVSVALIKEWLSGSTTFPSAP